MEENKVIRPLSNIDEWDDNHYEKEFIHEKSQHTCEWNKLTGSSKEEK